MGKKQPKATPKKQKIKEAKQAKKKEGGADADHADADQDKKLIAKMINDALGDKAKGLSKEETEALHQLGKQAMSAHKEMGKKDEEAYKCAGDALALAHHLGKKKKGEDEETDESEDEDKKVAKDDDEGGDKPEESEDEGESEGEESEDEGESEGEEDESEDEKESEDESESESEDEKESEDESESEGKKESNREPDWKKRCLEAEGRLAALRGTARKASLDGYIDKKLKESKLPSADTKHFRKEFGPFKSQDQFDREFKIFLEAVKRTKNSTDDLDWGVMMERATTSEDGDRTGSSDEAGFNDCAD